MTDEIRLKNYQLFKKKLNELEIDTSLMDERFGTQITNATFAITNEYNMAYDGSLLNTVLRILTPYALKINSLLPEHLQVDQKSIIKVCLLSHISKALTFIPNDNQWEIEKRGMLYKYAKNEVTLKMGMKSIFLAQEMGIKFTAQEMEAMIILDRDADDDQAKFFSSTLSTIIKQANELTYLQIRNPKIEEEKSDE